LGDSVDSRPARVQRFDYDSGGFWGIVWTAGACNCCKIVCKGFLGDSVDSRRFLCGTKLSTIGSFLGDSVDSRLRLVVEIVYYTPCFWGIVWTAGVTS